MKFYREVEFLCANSSFPGFETILEKHRKLFNAFKKDEDSLPYRQDFSDDWHKEFSFAVIILTDFANEKLRYIKSQARKVKLLIDSINKVPSDFVDKAVRGDLANLMKSKEENKQQKGVRETSTWGEIKDE